MELTENLGQNQELDSPLKLELVDIDNRSITIESDGQIELIVKALSSETRRSILQQIQITQEGMDVSNIAANLKMTEANISAQNLMAYILAKEKESTRQIAVMYFLNGMTIKEIAETKHLSVSGVHKHLDKLRRKIRDKGEI